MQSLTGDEPHLELGDSGEWVLQAQVRLYLLGIYRSWPDATYDMTTESAVRELQGIRGLDNDGEMNQASWEAILYLEQQEAIDYYWHSPYDALAQIQYDLEHPAPGTTEDGTLSEDGQYRWNGSEWVEAAGGPGQLSEDGQWQWDGSSWQPAAGAAGLGGGDPSGGDQSGAGQLSEDGQYRWNGVTWEPADAAAGGGQDFVGQLSEDGQWRWDGTQWQAA